MFILSKVFQALLHHLHYLLIQYEHPSPPPTRRPTSHTHSLIPLIKHSQHELLSKGWRNWKLSKADRRSSSIDSMIVCYQLNAEISNIHVDIHSPRPQNLLEFESQGSLDGSKLSHNFFLTRSEARSQG